MRWQRPWVVFGLEGIQHSACGSQASTRVLQAYLTAMELHQPQVLGAISYDPRLPVPELYAVLPSDVPLIATDVVPSQQLAGHRIVFHAMSMFSSAPLDLLWPSWAREASVAFVAGFRATSCPPTTGATTDHRIDRLDAWSHINAVEQADAVITESHAAAVDLIGGTAVDPERVFVAHDGTPRDARPHSRGPTGAFRELPRRLRLRPGFVIASGAADLDETHRLITAYGYLDPDLRGKRQLVISIESAFEDLGPLENLVRSLDMEDEIVLVCGGDEALIRLLYQSCHLMVQPSLMAASSTRCLEAMACGSVTIVGDVGVLREIVPQPEGRFDPGNSDSISRLLERALTDDHFRNARLADSQRSIERMSWKSSVKEAAAAYSFAALRRP